MTKPHPPLADPQLLDYYTSELLYMRALALEFAEQHPKIAARLGMQAGEIGDPYVERLVQASSFMTARTQMRVALEGHHATCSCILVSRQQTLSAA